MFWGCIGLQWEGHLYTSMVTWKDKITLIFFNSISHSKLVTFWLSKSKPYLPQGQSHSPFTYSQGHSYVARYPGIFRCCGQEIQQICFFVQNDIGPNPKQIEEWPTCDCYRISSLAPGWSNATLLVKSVRSLALWCAALRCAQVFQPNIEVKGIVAFCTWMLSYELSKLLNCEISIQ